MRGNSFGKMFSLTSFGESHGPAMGVVMDGVPPGLDFNLEELKKDLSRRAPGKDEITSSRKEADLPIVLSGIYDNKTLGTPIAILIENTNQKSEDYEKWKDEYRPGHADKTTMLKYGIRDHRGGGRASGRETVSRVIAGHFAKKILPPSVIIQAYIGRIADYQPTLKPTYNQIDHNIFGLHEQKVGQSIREKILTFKNEGNSLGGEIKLYVRNPPSALGEPCFDKLKADLAKAYMSIGGCVGVTLGAGEDFLKKTGLEISKQAQVFGGIEGGISNGDDITFSLIFKATSTVGYKAKEGRHDPCLLPRVIPVVEAMTAIVLADHYLRQLAYHGE